MARYFEITNSTPTVKLDSQGRATVQYKVKNVSAAPLDGRAVLISLPITTPPSGAVQKGWVKLATPPDHHFENNEETVFSVKIEVPPKDRTASGSYTFRLDAVLVSVPDRGDQGEATSFSFDGKPETKPSLPVWLIPAIAVVLIGIGIGLWLALRGRGGDHHEGGSKVPDVTGKTMTDAVASLASAKLTVNPNVASVSVDPKMAGKVISQSPSPGTPVEENGTVKLTLGASKTLVPLLTGKTVQEAQDLLNSYQLVLGNVSVQVTADAPSGVVVSQSQAPGTQVDTNTSLNVAVTPQQVAVPNVVGRGLSDASNILRAGNLQLGSLACDLLTSPITGQSPAAGAAAQVGSPVNLTFPCSVRANPQLVFNKGSAMQKAFVVNPYLRGPGPVPPLLKKVE